MSKPELKDFAGLVANIAAALGGAVIGVRGEERCNRWATIEVDGVALSVSWDNYRARLNVSIEWPRNGDSAGRLAPSVFMPRAELAALPTLDANVNPERDPAVLAKDIRRRVLVPGAPVYSRAVQYAKQQQDFRDARAGAAAALAARFGYQQSNHNREALYPAGSSLPALSVGSADSVRFEAFYLPFDVAVQVLEAIKAATA